MTDATGRTPSGGRAATTLTGYPPAVTVLATDGSLVVDGTRLRASGEQPEERTQNGSGQHRDQHAARHDPEREAEQQTRDGPDGDGRGAGLPGLQVFAHRVTVAGRRADRRFAVRAD